jgi:hypothetical protein
MKYIIFIICALSIIPTASAADGWREKCKVIQDGAETAMRARQRGMDMSRVMGIVSGSELAESVVMEAYDRPKYTGAAAKQDSINRFKNEYYLECAKLLRNK